MKKRLLIDSIFTLFVFLSAILLCLLEHKRESAEPEPSLGVGAFVVFFTVILLCEIIIWRSLVCILCDVSKSKLDFIVHSVFILLSLIVGLVLIDNQFLSCHLLIHNKTIISTSAALLLFFVLCIIRLLWIVTFCLRSVKKHQ